MSAGLAPRWASAPGSTLKAVMDERGLGLEGLAELLSMTLIDAKALIDGNRPIDMHLAQLLSSSVGASARFWLTREAEYREDQERLRADEWAQKFPVRQMSRFGWLKQPVDWREQIDECLKFFDVHNLDEWTDRYENGPLAVHYRKSPTFPSDDLATLAWFRAAERIRERKQEVFQAPFNETRLRDSIPDIRRLTRQANPLRFLPALERLLQDAGLHLAVLPAPAGCRASGATRWVTGRPFIQLSARHLSDDHFWFTLFHEIGHVLLHGDHRVDFLDDDVSGDNRDDDLEVEADHFAGSALLGNKWAIVPATGPMTTRRLIEAAVHLGVGPGVLVGQLQHRGLIPMNRYNGLKRRYAWQADQLTMVPRR